VVAPRQARDGAADNSTVRPRRQSALALHSDLADAAALQALICADVAPGPSQSQRDVKMARWRSQASKGGMAYLSALPTSGRAFGMAAPQFREALRRAMGVERAAPGGACPGCQQELQSGAHIRSCSRGFATPRHTAVADALARMLRSQAGVRGVRQEARHMFATGTRPKNMMDISFPAGQVHLPVPVVQPPPPRRLLGGLAVRACLDVTIRDGTCLTHRATAAADIAAGLVTASEKKITRYVMSDALDLRQTTLFSVAMDQFGACSADTHALIRTFALRQAAISGGVYTPATCVGRWRQQLSVALQNAISNSVLDAWPRIRAIPGQPAPALTAYRQTWLLSHAPPSGALRPD
jgi:hypothetical protein